MPASFSYAFAAPAPAGALVAYPDAFDPFSKSIDPFGRSVDASPYAELEPLVFGDLVTPALDGLPDDVDAGTPPLSSAASSCSPLDDAFTPDWPLLADTFVASPLGGAPDMPLFAEFPVPDFAVPEFVLPGALAAAVVPKVEAISPQLTLLDSFAGPQRTAPTARRARRQQGARQLSASPPFDARSPGSDGSAYSPDEEPEPERKPKARRQAATTSRKAVKASSSSSAPTATSRRDVTDTYVRFVASQVKKGRSVADADVEAEARQRAEAKREANRLYARQKLATGRNKIAALEQTVAALEADNVAIAAEVAELEAELAALGGSL